MPMEPGAGVDLNTCRPKQLSQEEARQWALHGRIHQLANPTKKFGAFKVFRRILTWRSHSTSLSF